MLCCSLRNAKCIHKLLDDENILFLIVAIISVECILMKYMNSVLFAIGMMPNAAYAL